MKEDEIRNLIREEISNILETKKSEIIKEGSGDYSKYHLSINLDVLIYVDDDEDINEIMDSAVCDVTLEGSESEVIDVTTTNWKVTDVR